MRREPRHRAGPKASGYVYQHAGRRGPVWYAKGRGPDGKQFNRALGPAWTKKSSPPPGHLTKRGALELLRTMLQELDGAQALSAQVAGATFGDACTEWLRHVEHDRGRKPSTLAGYRRDVVGTLLPAFGEKTPLEFVDERAIEVFRSGLLAKELSNRTINKYLQELHAIFRRAQRVWGLFENPARQIDRQPLRRSNRISFLTKEELEALARAAKSDGIPAYGPEQDAALWVTAAMTGLRWGELRQLRWRDVDFEHALVHVRHETKSDYARSVPLADRVARALDGLSQREHFTCPDDLVFVNEVGRAIDYSKSTKAYRRALSAAGLPRLRFHDLRHTFGTYAIRHNPVADVKEWMGHADLKTTMVYVHYVPQHDAASRLNRAFEAGDPPSVVETSEQTSEQSP